YSCGIHPLNLDEGYNFEELARLAADEDVVAMGETGLDYYYQKENAELQRTSFREHIRIGRELNKPVIVHTRDARDDTLLVLREE
ncbi:TatD family hydrolase, partial [Xenorhabdus bovienii]|uniref:TatD family hydrolase n=2 Tax=Xenorhabdus TaxID=626 RepID=UPI0023B33164